MQFSKYEGCGNDFLIFDNRENGFVVSKDQITYLCNRKMGIGADGVILLENSSQADFRMRIFNADGSEAEMCGNGIRCLFKFIQELGYSEESYLIETMEKDLRVSAQDGEVSVEMANPYDIRWNQHLLVGDTSYLVHSMNTGVPHAVIFSDCLQELDVNQLAPPIRCHASFQPKGSNVNFASIQTNGIVKVRTFERGVEAETLACGTGATATAIIAARLYGLEQPIKVQTASDKILKVQFVEDNQQIHQVTLAGPANFIFRGEITLEQNLIFK